MKTAETNQPNIIHSELWVKIFIEVSKMPRKDVERDALDHSSLTDIIEKLFIEYRSQPSDVSDDVQKFMSEVHEWADKTFGTERTALAPLYHLRKEVDEAIETMQTHNQWLTVEELADCFILILNSSSKYGLSFQELFTASKEKMDKNRLRTWGNPDENGVVEHIKDGLIKSSPVEDCKCHCPDSLRSMDRNGNCRGCGGEIK